MKFPPPSTANRHAELFENLKILNTTPEIDENRDETDMCVTRKTLCVTVKLKYDIRTREYLDIYQSNSLFSTLNKFPKKKSHSLIASIRVVPVGWFWSH